MFIDVKEQLTESERNTEVHFIGLLSKPLAGFNKVMIDDRLKITDRVNTPYAKLKQDVKRGCWHIKLVLNQPYLLPSMNHFRVDYFGPYPR